MDIVDVSLLPMKVYGKIIKRIVFILYGIPVYRLITQGKAKEDEFGREWL